MRSSSLRARFTLVGVSFLPIQLHLTTSVFLSAYASTVHTAQSKTLTPPQSVFSVVFFTITCTLCKPLCLRAPRRLTNGTYRNKNANRHRKSARRPQRVGPNLFPRHTRIAFIPNMLHAYSPPSRDNRRRRPIPRFLHTPRGACAASFSFFFASASTLKPRHTHPSHCFLHNCLSAFTNFYQPKI